MNHFIFNRLHNVIQNSSGFRAYPGLRTSRFVHTIGVMHVATQLFANASVNAEGRGLAALRKEAAKLTTDEWKKLKPEMGLHFKELSASFACRSELLLLLAVLRVAALVHDIGHLPFSHIFENALEVFLDERKDQFFKIKEETKTLRATLITDFKKVQEAEGIKSQKKDRKAIHEIVGFFLAYQLRLELGRDAFETEDEKLAGEQKFAAFLLKHAIAMLRGQESPITKSTISGTIDADRIDFTNRDGMNSGLFKSGIDFGRLFALYTVREKTGQPDNYWITPSPRTISDTEKLLWERFQDYRYINAHHKVHLYDEILENIIVYMLTTGELDDFIENLTSILNAEHSKNAKSRLAESKRFLGIMLEFDDTWLESRIRSLYKEHVTDSKPLPDDIKPLFEAYLEDRQMFKSVFKTDEDFWQKFADTRILKKLRAEDISDEKKSFQIEKMKDRRALVQESMENAKHTLQKTLSENLAANGIQSVILIGSTRRKIRYGIKSEQEASELGVKSLRYLLRQKKYETAPFNCWYTVNDTAKGKDIRAALIAAIDGFLMVDHGELDQVTRKTSAAEHKKTAVAETRSG